MPVITMIVAYPACSVEMGVMTEIDLPVQLVKMRTMTILEPVGCND